MAESRQTFSPGAIAVTVLALAISVAASGLEASSRSREQIAHGVPWGRVASRFREGTHFLSLTDGAMSAEACDHLGSDPSVSFALPVGETVSVRLGPPRHPSGSPVGGAIGIFLWAGEEWQAVSQVKPRIGSQQIEFTGTFDTDGLYSVPYVDAGGHCGPDKDVHVIASRNWKRGLLAFCRDVRERMEMNPDSELIRSSLAVAHWDHALQQIAEQRTLSAEALNALGGAWENTRAFDAGDVPDLVRGVNRLRLKRFPGAPVHEFVVVVPEACDGNQLWPVFLHTDGSRWAAREKYGRRSGWVDIWWHTTGDKDVDWRSFQVLMSLLERKLRLDPDRVYVGGECQNGLAAMSLALTHPDYWAECGVSLASSHREMAGNALNLATVFVKGGHTEEVAAGYYNFALRCFQHFGCQHLTHSTDQTIEAARGTPAPTARRIRRPHRVFWSVEALSHPRAYWVQINGREDENFLARVDARVTGQAIQIVTENVSAYTLDLKEAPLEPNAPVEIVHNGQAIDTVRGPVFSWASDTGDDPSVMKKALLCGPVADAFQDPFFVVWGGGSADEAQMNGEIAAELAGDAPCFRDDAVPEALVDSHHMVLVGSPESNQWLRRVHAALPVSLHDDGITAAGRHYRGRDLGVILLYPNPLNRRRYVVVFSGLSAQALRSLPRAYSELQSLRPADVGIFQIVDGGATYWHRFETFDTRWSWHKDWNEIVAVTRKPHPAWQWRRWLTQAVKEQLEADLAICEDPLLFDRAPGEGGLTFRDLANACDNPWLVKVELDGRKVRQLLMAALAEAGPEPADPITIEGVALFDSGLLPRGAGLSLDTIVDTRLYTLACNQKYLNGQRVGRLFQDYRIVGQSHLLPLLKKHVVSQDPAAIEAQLDRLTLQLF